MRGSLIITVVFSALFLSLFSCGNKKEIQITDENDDILVTFNDSSLTVADVVSLIPSGLTAEDSTNMFNSIVEKWVLERSLGDYAEKNIPDMDKIDKMVEQYRANLIVTHYLESMSESARKEVQEDRIKQYYDDNHSEMILEQPLVKGVFIKVADNNESLGDLRKWFASFNEKSLDNIEKSGLRNAQQFKSFTDGWIEWNAVAEQIPYRFSDADAFLKSNKNFETQQGSSIYLLHISEFIPSGSEMPYDYAKIKIAEILQNADVTDYRKKLINEILGRQIKDGTLKPGLYNPLNK